MLSALSLKINTLRAVALLAVVFVFMAGCSEKLQTEAKEQKPSKTIVVAEAGHALQDEGIQWYQGSVAAAFADAKAQSKPVLLYWGAEWCPPCAQLKATIFKQQDFIAKTRLFVPVYLDGDEPNAQAQGETFGVRGYPTLIVLSPDGLELTRIPGGLELDRYAKVLDLTLRDVRPVKASFEAVVAGQSVNADDFRLLAYYSWGQDNQRVLSEHQNSEAFEQLYRACPGDMAEVKIRLYLIYLQMRIADLEENEHLPLDVQQSALAQLDVLLAQPSLVRSNLDFLFYELESTIAALADVESEDLPKRWLAAVQAQADNEKLSLMERLGPLNVEVGVERLLNNEISPALKNKIQTRLAWADNMIHNDYERQSVVNMSWGILSDAGMDAEGEALLTAAMAKSSSPYYFMVDIADVAQRAGRSEEAIAWLARAYSESEGPATRVQWGVMYVMGLVEMTPGDSTEIKTKTLKVLSELKSGDDYYQRNFSKMMSMSQALLKWSEAGQHRDVIDALRANRDERCERLESGSEAKSNCLAFLSKGLGSA